jgi:hypothetical protein
VYRWILQRSIAVLLYVLHALLHFTCRKEFKGRERLQKLESAILCFWHVAAIPFATAYLHADRKIVYLTLDDWRTWPIHWLLKRMRIGPMITLDSRRPVQQIIRHLTQGYSTVVTPDGPAGPPKILRRGVLQMALRSGSPIMPVQVEAPHACVFFWSWDRKRIPLPFSKVTVRFGEPIYVTEATLDEARERLQAALG